MDKHPKNIVETTQDLLEVKKWDFQWSGPNNVIDMISTQQSMLSVTTNLEFCPVMYCIVLCIVFIIMLVYPITLDSLKMGGLCVKC